MFMSFNQSQQDFFILRLQFYYIMINLNYLIIIFLLIITLPNKDFNYSHYFYYELN